MAERLIDMGVPTTLWARNPAAVEPFGDGATIAADAAELGRRSDVVGVCVTDGAAVRAVTLGPDGCARGDGRGQRPRHPLHDRHRRVRRDRRRGRARRRARHRCAGERRWRGSRRRAADRLRRWCRRRASIGHAPCSRPTAIPSCTWVRSGADCGRSSINNALNAAHFALAHDAMAIGEALGLDAEQLGDRAAQRERSELLARGVRRAAAHSTPSPTTSGRSWPRTSSLFAGEATPSPAPTARSCSAPADRFLALVGPPAAGRSRRGHGGASMTESRRSPAPSVDTRTRNAGAAAAGRPADVLGRRLVATRSMRNGDPGRRRTPSASGSRRSRSTSTATRGPCVVGGAASRSVAGAEADAASSALDRDAFADLVVERRTALGLVDRRPGRGRRRRRTRRSARGTRCCARCSTAAAVYRPGDVALHAPRRLGRSTSTSEFRLGERPAEAAHFLAEAGFLLLHGRLHRRRDRRDRRRPGRGPSPTAARPDDGDVVVGRDAARASSTRAASSTSRGSRRRLRTRFDDDRFLAIGRDPRRRPRARATRSASTSARSPRRGWSSGSDSVEGLACLPWHKDCDRGGHSMYCSGLTIGICLTPVDEAHGGLDVDRGLAPGEHRPRPGRRRARPPGGRPCGPAGGDVTVHLSCTLHRSTHPDERASDGSPTPASRCRPARATAPTRRDQRACSRRERAGASAARTAGRALAASKRGSARA